MACTGFCEWRWLPEKRWERFYFSCSNDCGCAKPDSDGDYFWEVRQTPCIGLSSANLRGDVTTTTTQDPNSGTTTSTSTEEPEITTTTTTTSTEEPEITTTTTTTSTEEPEEPEASTTDEYVPGTTTTTAAPASTSTEEPETTTTTTTTSTVEPETTTTNEPQWPGGCDLYSFAARICGLDDCSASSDNVVDGWDYYKVITISDTSYVAGSGGSDVLNSYPVFIKIVDDADLATYAAADGSDIRFTNNSKSKLLPFIRKTWVVADGKVNATFIVRADVDLRINNNIRIWFGNSIATDASDTEVPSRVYTGGYHTIYDFEATVSGAYPNTVGIGGVNRHLVPTNASTVASELGQSIVFDQSLGNSFAITDDTFSPGQQLSIECAFKIPAGTPADQALVTYYSALDPDVFIELRITAEDKLELRCRGVVVGSLPETYATRSVVTTNTVNKGTDVNFASASIGLDTEVSNSLIMSVMLNKDIANTTTSTVAAVTGLYAVYRIGCAGLQLESTPVDLFTGSIEEIRLSSVRRNLSWFVFTQDNLFNTDNCLTFSSLYNYNEEPSFTSSSTSITGFALKLDACTSSTTAYSDFYKLAQDTIYTEEQTYGWVDGEILSGSYDNADPLLRTFVYFDDARLRLDIPSGEFDVTIKLLDAAELYLTDDHNYICSSVRITTNAGHNIVADAGSLVEFTATIADEPLTIQFADSTNTPKIIAVAYLTVIQSSLEAVQLEPSSQYVDFRSICDSLNGYSRLVTRRGGAADVIPTWIADWVATADPMGDCVLMPEFFYLQFSTPCDNKLEAKLFYAPNLDDIMPSNNDSGVFLGRWLGTSSNPMVPVFTACDDCACEDCTPITRLDYFGSDETTDPDPTDTVFVWSYKPVTENYADFFVEPAADPFSVWTVVDDAGITISGTTYDEYISATGSASCYWRFWTYADTEAGSRYAVYVTWNEDPANNTIARYTLCLGNETDGREEIVLDSVLVDQTQAPTSTDKPDWYLLGVYDIFPLPWQQFYLKLDNGTGQVSAKGAALQLLSYDSPLVPHFDTGCMCSFNGSVIYVGTHQCPPTQCDTICPITSDDLALDAHYVGDWQPVYGNNYLDTKHICRNPHTADKVTKTFEVFENVDEFGNPTTFKFYATWPVSSTNCRKVIYRINGGPSYCETRPTALAIVDQRALSADLSYDGVNWQLLAEVERGDGHFTVEVSGDDSTFYWSNEYLQYDGLLLACGDAIVTTTTTAAPETTTTTTAAPETTTTTTAAPETTTTTADPAATTTTTTTTTTTPEPSSMSVEPVLDGQREQIAVDQEQGGTYYPFLQPSNNLDLLLGDLFLFYKDWCHEYVPPFKLDYLYGFGNVAAVSPITAIHPHEIKISDANGTVVFDSTAANYYKFALWGTDKVVIEWKNASGEILRVVKYISWPDGADIITWPIYFEPTDARLDVRAIEEMPRSVTSIIVETPTGPVTVTSGNSVVLSAGYNMEIDVIDSDQDYSSRDAVIELNCEPGSGAGRYTDCVNDGIVRTINGQEADNYGNLRLLMEECYRVAQPNEHRIPGFCYWVWRASTRIWESAGNTCEDGCDCDPEYDFNGDIIVGGPPPASKYANNPYYEPADGHVMATQCNTNGLTLFGSAVPASGSNPRSMDLYANTVYLSNDCGPCCDCQDYINVYEAIRKLDTSIMALGALAEDTRDLFKLNIERWEEQLVCRTSQPMRSGIIPYAPCRAAIGGGFCNTTDEVITNLELRFTLSGVLDGCILCGTTFIKGNTALTSANYEPVNRSRPYYDMAGTWPTYSMTFACVGPGESVSATFAMEIANCVITDQLTLVVEAWAPEPQGPTTGALTMLGRSTAIYKNLMPTTSETGCCS